MHEIQPTSGGLLLQLSNELADAVERGGAATVRVNARRRLPATGIVWATSDTGSTIVTASHVVERDEDITITTADGRELPATLAGRDHGADIAVLTVSETLPVARRAADDEPRVGALALAIGRAGELTATTGVVAAVAGPWHGGRGHGHGRGQGHGPGHGRGNGRGGGQGRRRSRALIATDAPMFPGFSGGPLIDAGGQVLGLLSSHLGRGQTLAIPASEVDRIAAGIDKHGTVRRGYLGVAAQPVALPGGESGLLLVGIEENGPAHAAGLIVGDILRAIGEQPVGGLEDLRDTLDGDAVGQQVSASILRGGQPLDVLVTIGEQPEHEG